MARYGRKKFEPVSSSQSPRMADLTVGDYANGMPNIRLGEMFKSLSKQLPWMIILLIIGSAVAFHLTKDLKRVYSGHGNILVQLGEEHTYNPVGQSADGNGLTTTIDTITLTEAALMKNDDVIQEVIGLIAPPLDGSGRNRTNSPAQNKFNKEAFTKINQAKNERDRRDAVMELRRDVGESYSVMPRAKSSVIDVVFKHEDPDIAVATTNAFINSYIQLRRRVYVEGSSEIISDRREATEAQLLQNERAIASFLQKNDIGDFESEQTGLRERTEDLKASLNETRASIAETEAALAQVEDQLRGTAQTIDLYVDDRAQQRVSQAELELRQLMAKYLPTSDPVKQKQTELDELRALQSSYNGRASGGRRVGPNPTHQTLTESRNELAATADSLREREFTQQRQLNSADGKVRKLASLSPAYQNLLRERETLKSRLDSYNSKEQEALVDAQQAEDQAENIKVISWAEFANKGRNMRKWAWLGATAAWGFVLFFIAMIRVFLDPRLYAVPGAVQSIPMSHPIDDMNPAHYPLEDPLQSPIPEPIPAFDPGQPMAPNPYEVQPGVAYSEPAAAYTEPAAYADGNTATAYPQTGAYNRDDYVLYTSHSEAFGSQPMPGDMTAMENPYQSGYAQPNPAYPAQAYDGTGALDINHNPYALGEVQAGSLDDYSGYAPVPTAPPQS